VKAASARARGVLFGGPGKLTPLREIALSYAVDHSTISRLKARHAAEV
jgi:hypothetical protein